MWVLCAVVCCVLMHIRIITLTKLKRCSELVSIDRDTTVLNRTVQVWWCTTGYLGVVCVGIRHLIMMMCMW